ncbi:MAG: hypothetical protein O6950_14225 [Gammaproteobacteria bacterium]|nr:hypothetical protein [Gammaproteobacteria bacterium]
MATVQLSITKACRGRIQGGGVGRAESIGATLARPPRRPLGPGVEQACGLVGEIVC